MHASSPTRQPLDVAIVGAGQSGLAVAWHLRRRGSSFLLLDAAQSLGESWRSRWDSLRLFTPAEYCGLPGMPFPAAPGTYPTKDQTADYLVEYAARFQLPVLSNARVQSLTRDENGFFVLRTSQGLLRARRVVVATGAFQQPFRPAAAHDLDPRLPQLHSGEYRRPDDLPAGKVLVVGAGNSGLQIAEELAATREVHVAMGSKQTMIPQRLLGRDLFWWLTRTGLIDRPVTSPVTKAIRRRGGDLVIGTSRKSLSAAGVRLRPRLVAGKRRAVRFADNTNLDVDAVVWATGFRADYGWIEIHGACDDQGVRHDRGVSRVPGLYFVGLPWQHTRGSALLGFVQQDAAFIAERITASVPSVPQ